jgi:hypothetical protein
MAIHGWARRPVGFHAALAASLAFTRATVTADQTAAPAGVGKLSAVSFAASARSDSEPSGSSRAMIGASDAAWPAALSDRTLRPLAPSFAVGTYPRKPPSF